MKKSILCIIFSMSLLLQCSATVTAEQSCEDLLGGDFLNKLIFFGESTTTHLKQRSPLRNDQIWANASGTARLDSNLAYRPVINPQNGLSVSPIELARQTHPDYLVLSFGLNGIINFSKNTDHYLQCYRNLIESFSEVSPNTHFLIQSIYPVACDHLQLDWQFSISPEEINQKIDLLNRCIKNECETISGVFFIDTSCNLKDADGFLRPEYTTDGIHLTETAYHVILNEIAGFGKDILT